MWSEYCFLVWSYGNVFLRRHDFAISVLGLRNMESSKMLLSNNDKFQLCSVVFLERLVLNIFCPSSVIHCRVQHSLLTVLIPRWPMREDIYTAANVNDKIYIYNWYQKILNKKELPEDLRNEKSSPDMSCWKTWIEMFWKGIFVDPSFRVKKNIKSIYFLSSSSDRKYMLFHTHPTPKPHPETPTRPSHSTLHLVSNHRMLYLRSLSQYVIIVIKKNIRSRIRHFFFVSCGINNITILVMK